MHVPKYLSETNHKIQFKIITDIEIIIDDGHSVRRLSYGKLHVETEHIYWPVH